MIRRTRPGWPYWALCGGLATLMVVFSLLSPKAHGSSLGPQTKWHYTANGNFDSSGNYLPGKLGFNVADVSSASALQSLPTGVEGLLWVGQCSGVTTQFRSTINGYVGKMNLLGFYLMDDADPTGKWGPLCTAASLRAEADYIHATVPGALAFIVPMNLSSSKTPLYDSSYSQANTHLDAFGLDPYPCRTELNGCNYDMITGYVSAAEKIGIPSTAIVPVYQTFGLGGWTDDGGGQYAVPTPAQEQTILDTWAGLVPTPQFDYAYSYGVQNSDMALVNLPSLQPVMAQHNGGASAPTQTPPTQTATPTTAAPTPTHSTAPTPPWWMPCPMT